MSFRIMFFFGIIVGLVDLFLKIDEIVVFLILPEALSTKFPPSSMTMLPS